MTKQKQNGAKRGVTLVEIAIVLVIIGLLLGGVLKGQELINNAKIRAIADRQNSLKVSWFAFIDRFQALPGDYVSAMQYIPGAGAASVVANSKAGDGIISTLESPIVFQHLTGAGYLRCPQCVAGVPVAPAANNSLQNSYGGIMGVFTNGCPGGAVCAAANITYARRGAGGPRLMVHTGSRIPSNIITEVDRKLDDGLANTGDVVLNLWAGKGAAPAVTCMDDGAGTAIAIGANVQAFWRSATLPVDQNCQASVNI